MAAQKGSILYIADGTGTAATAIVALRSTDITLNNQPVDVTNRDSSGYRELLAGAGIYNMTIKGSGVVTDSTSFGTLSDRVKAATLDNYTVHFSDSHTFVGAFQLSQMDFKGEYNGMQSYDMQFESSGSITRA